MAAAAVSPHCAQLACHAAGRAEKRRANAAVTKHQVVEKQATRHLDTFRSLRLPHIIHSLQSMPINVPEKFVWPSGPLYCRLLLFSRHLSFSQQPLSVTVTHPWLISPG